jgi:hypothetical protein
LISITRLRLAHFCYADPRLRKPGISLTSADRAIQDDKQNSGCRPDCAKEEPHCVVASLKAQFKIFAAHLV